MRKSKTVYVFPVINPGQPQRDDKRLRLHRSQARNEVVEILATPRNWYTGLFTIGQPDNQPTNIGLLFRDRGKELVLFFENMTIEAKFGDEHMIGMLEEKARNKMEQWKQQYAHHELAAK